MTTAEYLAAVLKDQALGSNSDEMEMLREHKEIIKGILTNQYGSAPSIRYGGSIAKKTANRESYDLDIPVYFPHDDTSAGETLGEIYDDVADTLESDYSVVKKRSALRLHDLSDTELDFHIDVVPGRFIDETKGDDVFVYQNSAEKERLKTNLTTHVSHIRDSGFRDAIRLIKLWNVRQSLDIKTFVLELLVVDLLKDFDDDDLAEQLLHVWEEFRNNAESLSVDDPANPEGNDLSDFLDEIRTTLRLSAQATLDRIEEAGWGEIFGEIEEDKAAKVAAIATAVKAVEQPHRPWCHGSPMV